MSNPQLLIEYVDVERIERVPSTRQGRKVEGAAPSWYLSSPLLFCGAPNRNKRVYQKHVVEPVVVNFMEEKVLKDCAWGEFGHPNGPKVNEERISHRFVDMWWAGDVLWGKCQVLDEGLGKIVISGLERKGKFGFSLRGLGSVKSRGDGIDVVQDDWRLATIDIVTDPSSGAMIDDVIFEGVQDAPVNNTGNVDGLHDAPAARKKHKDKLDVLRRVAEALATNEIKLGAERNQVNTKPTTKEGNEQPGRSSTAETLKRKGQHGMKEGFAGGTSSPGGYGNKAPDMTKDAKPHTRHKPQTVGRIRESDDDMTKAIKGLLQAIARHVDKSHPVSRRAKALYDACVRWEGAFEGEEVYEVLAAFVEEMEKLDQEELASLNSEAEAIIEGVLAGLTAAPGSGAKNAATRAATSALGGGTASLVLRAAKACRSAHPKPPKPKTSTTTPLSSARPMVTKSGKGTANNLRESAEFKAAVRDEIVRMQQEARDSRPTIVEQAVAALKYTSPYPDPNAVYIPPAKPEREKGNPIFRLDHLPWGKK